jgi:ribosome-associated translation inhibitor RaiA
VAPVFFHQGIADMQVLVRTDNNIEGTAELTQQITTVVESAVARFGDRITRVEAYLSDQNSDKKDADDDKRCVLEARVAGIQPISVRESGATVEQAVDAAAEKLVHVLDRTLGKLDDPKGRTSFAGDQTT